MIAKLFIFFVAIAYAHGNQENMKKIIHDLAEYSNRDPSTYLQAIIPGTKWCGDGDIAETDGDLGIFKKTDLCCRDHDKCDDVILAGESKHGLNNTGLFTRLHCKCDLTFFACLKDADKLVSHIVGTGYFNGLGGQCYDEKPPATCEKYESIVGLRKRCVKYSFDETKPHEWQWFDVPRYID